MTTAIIEHKPSTELSPMEAALLVGDLSKLTEQQRGSYYHQVCQSLGINPLTRPFEYITFQGKLTLYARRDAAEQLRKINRVNVEIIGRDRTEEYYIVTARATTPDGRFDESTGAVSLAGLKGEAFANQLMKAETKAKRRVTLSICGLGWLDESEVETLTERPAPPENRLRLIGQNAQPVPAAADPNAEPRPDAEKVSFMPDGRPVWRVAGVECIRSNNGRGLISMDACPEHDKPFGLPLDPADTDWRHGRGGDACHLSDVLLRQQQGVADDFDGMFDAAIADEGQ